MKLYPEEQVKEMIEKSRQTYLSAEFIILTNVPIELPSDEEIEEYFSWGYGGDSGSAIYGAKWIKEQILNQNNK